MRSATSILVTDRPRKRPRFLTACLPIVLAGVAVTQSTGQTSSGAATVLKAARPSASVPYGAGKGFCSSWGGLSHDAKGISDVYPCANKNTSDKWGESQCADFTNRYEWATFGLTALTDGGEIVRTLHDDDSVPIQSPGKGNLPEAGDALSMWGGAGSESAGHTGVVYSVSVNSSGNGTIVYLDQNGSLINGIDKGEDTIYVSNWKFSTHWSKPYAYANFDWTLQADAYPNGTFIDYQGFVYRMAGGAPLYVSSWAVFGGVQKYKTLTTAEFDGLKQYPANGTAVYAASGPTKGTGYVFAGGAPLVVTNWKNVGSPQITGVDPAVLDTYATTGAYSHVLQYPENGTAVYMESGASKGTGFVFAGGAPLVVTNWKNVGSPPVTGVDPAALENYATTGPFSHVQQYPANGTAVYMESGTSKGSGFVFAGGAPLYVANWKHVDSPKITGVDPAALENYATTGPFSHVQQYPTNGTFLTTMAGATYRVAGAYAFVIASCTDIGGCPSPTLIDAWSITNAGNSVSHLEATPANGTEVLAEPSGNYWTFESGQRSTGTGSSSAVEVDDTSVASFPIE
jgi:hypothetical protein